MALKLPKPLLGRGGGGGFFGGDVARGGGGGGGAVIGGGGGGGGDSNGAGDAARELSESETTEDTAEPWLRRCELSFLRKATPDFMANMSAECGSLLGGGVGDCGSVISDAEIGDNGGSPLGGGGGGGGGGGVKICVTGTSSRRSSPTSSISLPKLLRS